jgi:hypothetical protein
VRSVAAGSRITAADLGLAPMQIGSASGTAFSRPGAVIGHVALSRIGEGEVVQRSAIGKLETPSTSSGRARSISLGLPIGRALGGELQPGQYVDLLATSDTAGSTKVVARDALVTAVARPDDAIGSNDNIAVTLAVADEVTAVAVVDANETGKVSITAPAGVSLPEQREVGSSDE